MSDPSVTEILNQLGRGEPAAMRALLPKVYDELRRLAAVHIGEERSGHTLQPTALVHEAFIRLADGPAAPMAGRIHFFRLASKVMRQVLVDHARGRAAAKREGGWQRITLDGGLCAQDRPLINLIDLEDALTKLEGMDERMARLVELRFFGGLAEEEAAEALGISRTQAARDWRTARAWLASELPEA